MSKAWSLHACMLSLCKLLASECVSPVCAAFAEKLPPCAQHPPEAKKVRLFLVADNIHYLFTNLNKKGNKFGYIYFIYIREEDYE